MDNQNSSSGRSKRVKADKTGRLAALERLKTLKGGKNKYEIIEETPVYEEVSEKDFACLVQQRQDEDWIIDDDGCGYVEDGREIFDDDDDAETEHTAKVSNQSSKKQKKNDLSQKSNNKVSNIKNMFKMQTAKRKNDEVKLDDDELLKSIMEETHNDPPQCSMPKPTVLLKKPKKSASPMPFTSPLRPPTMQRGGLNPFSVNSQRGSNGGLNSQRQFLKPKVVDFDRAELDGNRNTEMTPVIEKVVNTNGNAETDNASSEDMDFSNLSSDLFGSLDNDMEEFTESTSLFDNDMSENPNSENKVGKYTELASQSKNESVKVESVEEMKFLQNTFNLEPTSSSSKMDIKVDSDHLPIEMLKNNMKGIKFFWFDAFEDSYKQPGTVYLFGKVHLKECDTYVSCCIIVKNIPRKCYVLPQKTRMNIQTKAETGNPVTMQDVYIEMSSIAEKMKISEFKTKISEKNYAFENPDIPTKGDYMEIQYSAKFPPFTSDLTGATFSHVLGTDTSALEMLLLEQKLKGPCWLEIHDLHVSSPPVSWCKLEAVVSKMQNIVPSTEELQTPPVSLLALNLVTVVNSRTQQSEIVAISCLLHDKFYLDKVAPKPHYNSHFCALTKPSDCIFPYDFKTVIASNKGIKIECLDSERALLAYFLAKLYKSDPDVIIGHDVVGFDLDVLLHRLTSHKIPNWSRLGRLKRAGVPRFSSSSQGFVERNAMCGRLICDVKISAKELIRCRSYDLTELSNHVLDQRFEEISSENVRNYFMSSQKLLSLADRSMCCSDYILRISNQLNALPLALQITKIAGCVMSRTLLGGRSERNEYLLLHAFHEKNYIYPAKVTKKNSKVVNDESQVANLGNKKSRRKPAYEGGLVLDPKKGLYDTYILLMDFNSLYPSIIQEYNICFTTINQNGADPSKNLEDNLDAILPLPNSEPGILPTEIRKLVESRRTVKQMMKVSDISEDRLTQYDIRQRALKLTANSMYGCLGFSHSRFYAKSLAALVTRKGREILIQTKGLVEKMGLDVIYGDTDSIMINTNQGDYDGVFQLGNRVKAEINKLYRLLEIDIDGVYKPMLLLKKKKYAAMLVSRLQDGKLSTKQEIKGLDIVRRDWSHLAKEAGEFVLKEILSSKSKEEILESIITYLISLSEGVRSDKKPTSTFVILKQLTKQPEEYADAKNLSHVLVALRINAKGGKKLKQNDTVPYIICVDGSNLPFTQRAYHPDEVNSNSTLKIDVEYYLSNQVHPVVSRLCSPIEGTDSAMIAGLLGLDPTKYNTVVKEEEQYEDKLLAASSVLDDNDRFKSCDKLVLYCPSCIQEIHVDNVFKEGTAILQLSSCEKCNASLVEHASCLHNQLQRHIHKYVSKYYHRVLACEDSGCGHQTKKMPLLFTISGPLCPACKTANLRPQYTEEELYAQLAFFNFMFDIEKGKKQFSNEKDKIVIDKEEEKLYAFLKSAANKALKSSGYARVNLVSLFQGLFLPPSCQAIGKDNL